MRLIDMLIVILISVAVVYICAPYIRFTSDSMYEAVNLKASVFKDISIIREKKVPGSSLTIKKNYIRLILGSTFRKTEYIKLKSIYASCNGLDGKIEYSSTFPRCAGTIYAENWSISFQPVTGYMNIKLNKR